MKEKGYKTKSVSASAISAEDADTSKIIEAIKDDDICILVQFKDGINAEAYFETMYTATLASGTNIKKLKKSTNFFNADSTNIDVTSDKMISKENNKYIVYSRVGKMMLLVYSNYENSAISLSEELGY